jgi:hypothetical protein
VKWFDPGLPDGISIFMTKKANLGKFWKALERIMLVPFVAIRYTYFMAIWYILWSFGIFFPVVVCCSMKKSGNPATNIDDCVTCVRIFLFCNECDVLLVKSC